MHHSAIAVGGASKYLFHVYVQNHNNITTTAGAL
jgi:hypothetical protein